MRLSPLPPRIESIWGKSEKMSARAKARFHGAEIGGVGHVGRYKHFRYVDLYDASLRVSTLSLVLRGFR